MRRLALAAAALAMASTAYAQSGSPQGSPPHGMSMPVEMRSMMDEMMRSRQTARSPADRAYADAMDKMHRAMALDYTGNADADFARLMIPHHQGAIDMAQVALQFAKDAEIRRIAQKTIDDQKKDIEQLQSWLQRHPAATGASTGK